MLRFSGFRQFLSGVSRQLQNPIDIQILLQLFRKGIQMPAQFTLLLRHRESQMAALDVHGLTDRHRAKITHAQLFNLRTQAFAYHFVRFI